MVAKERLKVRHIGAALRPLPPLAMSRLQPHHPLSTTATTNVTPRASTRDRPDDLRHTSKPANPTSDRAGHPTGINERPQLRGIRDAENTERPKLPVRRASGDMLVRYGGPAETRV